MKVGQMADAPARPNNSDAARFAQEDELYLPQGKPDASYSQSGATAALEPYMLFKADQRSKLMIERPQYELNKRRISVIRPFACRNIHKPGGFEPYRLPETDDFGFWRKTVRAAYMVGDPAVTFLVHDPKTGMFDRNKSPVDILQGVVRNLQAQLQAGSGRGAYVKTDRIQRAFDPNESQLLQWTQLIQKSVRGATLDRSKDLTLMQCSVLVRDNMPLYGKGKTPAGWGRRAQTCVFILTQGPGRDLTNMLNQEVERYRGPRNDFEKRYVYGDVVSPEHGRFMVITPKGTLGDPDDSPVDAKSVWADSGPAAPGQPTEEDNIGYEIDLVKEWKGIPATLDDEESRAIMQERWQHWDKILWYPTPAEQVALMVGRLPDDLLLYAFYGEHTDWLPKELIDRVRESQQVVIQTGRVNQRDGGNLPMGNNGSAFKAPKQTAALPAHEVAPTPEPAAFRVPKGEVIHTVEATVQPAPKRPAFMAVQEEEPEMTTGSPKWGANVEGDESIPEINDEEPEQAPTPPPAPKRNSAAELAMKNLANRKTPQN